MESTSICDSEESTQVRNLKHKVNKLKMTWQQMALDFQGREVVAEAMRGSMADFHWIR